MRFFEDIPGTNTLTEVFTFHATTTPPIRLSFSRPSSPSPSHPPPVSRKRQRSVNDVDGEPGNMMKKKRRLRLTLITSRLSRPFSSPSSHICDRGNSKIAVWAKQKALGRNLLRKAAIMNRVRQQIAAAREVQQKQMEAARQAFLKQQLCAAQVPRRQYIPLPPSPLGLSNYDALDMEDDFHDDSYDESEGPLVYSDFNILEPSDPVYEDYDSLPQYRRPPTPPDEKVIELMMEKERQKELCFVRFA